MTETHEVYHRVTATCKKGKCMLCNYLKLHPEYVKCSRCSKGNCNRNKDSDEDLLEEEES